MENFDRVKVESCSVESVDSGDGFITVLLQRIRNGDQDAESELLVLVYDELHRAAVRQFQSEKPGHTLQPTALISELYLRLIRDAAIDWQSRAHFFAVAARTMRRILIDHARAASAQRRPPDACKVDLESVVKGTPPNAYELLLVDEALTRLAEWDPRQARIVELRIFAGSSIEETARIVGVSERTVKRDWAMACAWLAVTYGSPGGQ
jgi:RNA polymerase sigma factor (TIGR02999 family)